MNSTLGPAEATKEAKARWARERRARLKAGIHQPGRGEALRKFDHTGPTYKTQPSEYRIWAGMKVRCFNPKAQDWNLYGGRGITVCPEWKDSFAAFFNAVGPRPSPRHSIDRYPNGDGNYEPGNVRWATAREQAANWSRRNRKFTLDGETLVLAEWARRIGITIESLRGRLDSGWAVDRALSTPPVRQRKRGEDGTFLPTL